MGNSTTIYTAISRSKAFAPPHPIVPSLHYPAVPRLDTSTRTRSMSLNPIFATAAKSPFDVNRLFQSTAVHASQPHDISKDLDEPGSPASSLLLLPQSRRPKTWNQTLESPSHEDCSLEQADFTAWGSNKATQFAQEQPCQIQCCQFSQSRGQLPYLPAQIHHQISPHPVPYQTNHVPLHPRPYVSPPLSYVPTYFVYPPVQVPGHSLPTPTLSPPIPLPSPPIPIPSPSHPLPSHSNRLPLPSCAICILLSLSSPRPSCSDYFSFLFTSQHFPFTTRSYALFTAPYHAHTQSSAVHSHFLSSKSSTRRALTTGAIQMGPNKDGETGTAQEEHQGADTK